MRLNFSGVGEDDIREGIRRIGEVVREQVELYGTLTGTAPKPAPRRRTPPGAPTPSRRPERRRAPRRRRAGERPAAAAQAR